VRTAGCPLLRWARSKLEERSCALGWVYSTVSVDSMSSWASVQRFCWATTLM
jgi:hypothetical protein